MLLDGAALGAQESALMLAVLVHRLPMGFTIGAYLLSPKRNGVRCCDDIGIDSWI